MMRTTISPLRLGDTVRISGTDMFVIHPPGRIGDDATFIGTAVDISTGKYRAFASDAARVEGKQLDPTPVLMDCSQRILTTSGTDPEIFVSDGPGGPIIPAWKFLPSERLAPPDAYWHIVKAYWDGFQAEFSNTPGCVRQCHEFATYDAHYGLKAILQAARAKYPHAQLLPADVVDVGEQVLNEEDIYVQLGCAPSRNAYPDVHPITGVDGHTLPIRFSGCHIHIGFDFIREAPAWFPEGTIVMIDKIAGILLTALGRGLENPQRRIFYGRPGEFRIPKAAPDTLRLEYRTPGSFLLRSPTAFIFALDMVRAAARMGLLVDGRTWNTLPNAKDIIMKADADAAWAVIETHSDFFTTLLKQHYAPAAQSGQVLQSMFTTLRKGLVSRLVGRSVEAEWGLPYGNRTNSNEWWGYKHSPGAPWY